MDRKLQLALYLIVLAARPSFGTTWTWTLTGSIAVYGSGTFTACESGTKTKITGTYTRPYSGFVHLVKTTCSTCSDDPCATSCVADTGECSGVSTDVYAIEQPGVSLVVQPVLTNPTVETQPIYNVVTGSCPATNKTYIWSFAQYTWINNMTDASQVAVGGFSWDTNGTATVTSGYNATSWSSLGMNFALPNSGCTGGTITMTGNLDRGGTAYISDRGVFFYQTLAHHALFGVEQSPISNAKRLMGTYAGFAFSAWGSHGVVPITQVVVTSSATGFDGYKMTADTTIDSSYRRTFTISAIDSPINGMIKGSLSDGVNTGNLACVVQINNANHNLLFCSGQKPGNAAANAVPYSIILTSTGSWVNMGGRTTHSGGGTYGTRGVAASTNQPGGREYSTYGEDLSGNAYVFGGYGFDSSASLTRLNDVWKWDGTNWTWIAGDSTGNPTGTWGTLGVASSANRPSGRYSGGGWVSGSGNVFLWGGNGVDSNGAAGQISDLWKWDGTNWTWVAGPSVRRQAGTYGTKGVAASTNAPGAREFTTAWSDSSGMFYMFSGQGYDSAATFANLNDLWKYDGSNWIWMSGSAVGSLRGTYGVMGTASSANAPGGRIYATSAYGSSGSLIFGGFSLDKNGQQGATNDLWKWDGTNWTWLAGNDVRFAKGTFGTRGQTASTNMIPAKEWAFLWPTTASDVYVFGGNSYGDSTGTGGSLNDLWKWDGTNWTWLAANALTLVRGSYGTRGVPNAQNGPGARLNGASWTDSDNNLWMFGGRGTDNVGAAGRLNCLWRASSW